MVEGVRSAREALDSDVEVRLAVIAPRLESLVAGRELVGLLDARGARVARATDRELEKLSDTEAPQGVLLVCDRSSRTIDELAAGRLLALDGLQDPGNVGTLIRSARAFGLDGVVALAGTADPWGPKAVRSSAGSVFHMTVAECTEQALVAWAGRRQIGLKVAEGASGRPWMPKVASDPWILVIGNEGAGVGDRLRRASDEVIGVPMLGGVESLNAAVAGSILMYLLTRAETRMEEAR